MKNYPRVWKLKDILDHATNTDGAVSVCVRGRLVPARPMGWPSIKSRFKAAWLVFTGKADAVTWPEDDAA